MDRSDLVRNLEAVYNDAWDDEGVRDRLIAEPRAVLAEHGLELQATVKVEAELVDVVPGAPVTVEGDTVKLKVPATRPVDVGTREIPDEELEGVSGGWSFWDLFNPR